MTPSYPKGRTLIRTAAMFFLLTASSGHAAEFYVANGLRGSGDASSCSNAKSISWNWLNPNVVDGDTVYICGTISNTLTIPKGGASTAITVKFCKDNEAGCSVGNQGKFSTPAWGTGTAAAIYASGISHITIDGGTNGVIESTGNSDTSGTSQQANGIDITSCNNWEIKNLTIQSMMVHTYGSNDSTVSRGISASDCSGTSIHDNTINNAYYGIVAGTNHSSMSAIYIYGNTISSCSTGIAIALGNSGTSMDQASVHGNDINMGLNWYDPSDNNHIDGIHVWGRSDSADQITNLQIYSNKIHGDCSAHSTALVYLEYDVISPLIYNNLLYTHTNKPANGYVYIKERSATPPSFPGIYNNTILGIGGANGGNGIDLGTNASCTVDLKNNILAGLYAGIYHNARVSILKSDYSDFFAVSYIGWLVSNYPTLAAWTVALGGCPGLDHECNSKNSDPLFRSPSDFNLLSGSPCRDAGKDLSVLFNSDILGVQRPQGPAWDMGAYEYRLIQPPTNLKIQP